MVRVTIEEIYVDCEDDIRLLALKLLCILKKVKVKRERIVVLIVDEAVELQGVK